ncbi:MAG TPA: large-conductance mechanosensitive channel protein MscL [Bacteroidales bacterium]|nr:large-conductance mechanosensitive channel protein MscL [Bacteroidales bacterium]HPT10613.1 large-conductance mechanosensitive channel protein MscL [Bacteroidales bacterium]
MKMIQEFKEFAMKGNVIDMAVGIILGAAFGKIVASVVNDVIMPPVGLLVGGIDFKDIVVNLRDAVVDPSNGQVIKAAVVLRIGVFLQTVVDFLIIAFSIFMLIKGVNKFSRKKQAETVEAPPEPPAPTRDQELLTEIRDLLKNK